MELHCLRLTIYFSKNRILIVMLPSLNVLGTELQKCSTSPLTGWFRDGCCNTDRRDNVSGDTMLDNSKISTKTNVFTFTSGTPKNITVSETDNMIKNVGESTDYIVAQMEVDSTVSLKGDLTDRTWYFIFDEL